MPYTIINGAEINGAEASATVIVVPPVVVSLDRVVSVDALQLPRFGATIAIPGGAPQSVSCQVDSLGVMPKFGQATVQHGVSLPVASMPTSGGFGAVVAQMAQPVQSLRSTQFGSADAVQLSSNVGLLSRPTFGSVVAVRIQPVNSIVLTKFGTASLKSVMVGPAMGGLNSVVFGDARVGLLVQPVRSMPPSARFGPIILQRGVLC